MDFPVAFSLYACFYFQQDRHITFIYQNADGTRDYDKRVFLSRDSRGRVRQSGEPHALIPGTYTVKGWHGTYDEIVFEVKAGENREIVLRNKE